MVLMTAQTHNNIFDVCKLRRKKMYLRQKGKQNNVYVRINVLFNVVILGHGQQRIPAYTWKTALVERMDLHLEAFVFARHLLGVLVSVERIHQNEWNVGIVSFV